MMPPPIAAGLAVCDHVIAEQRTNKISLIGIFLTFRTVSFSLTPVPFCVFATLMSGTGEAEVTLVLTRLDDGEDIYELIQRLHFPDRLSEVNVLFRLANCTFPAPGSYQFTLFVDYDPVAQRGVRALLIGE